MISNNQKLEQLHKIRCAYYQDNFYAFCRDWWEIINGMPFKPHYTVEMVCEYIELNIKGDIEWLLLSLPRGWGKSKFVSEYAPAWALLRDPYERIGAFSRALTEDAKMWHGASLNIMENPRTEFYFPEKEKRIVNASRIIYRTEAGGYRKVGSCLSSSVGSDMTLAVIDDPADQEHYRSEAKQMRLANFFKKSLFRAVRTTDYTISENYLAQLTPQQKSEYNLTVSLEKEVKGETQKKPRLLLTMQRLHDNDPVGMILNIQKEMSEASIKQSFEYVKIPAIHEEPRKYFFPISKIEHEVQENEYTLAGTLTKEGIEKARIQMLEEDFQAQMQQNPPLQSGTFFKREWLKYEENLFVVQFDNIYLSFDTAYKTKEWNDPTACLVFGLKKNKIYVLESYVKRVDYTQLKQVVYGMVNKYKAIANVALLIEDKGSGQSLIQDLNNENVGNIIPIKPEGSKEHRMQLAIGNLKIILEAGNFILPKRAPWLTNYENELLSFPNCIHDDQVDATSQFMNHIHSFIRDTTENMRFIPLN